MYLLLVALGITYIVKYGTILHGLREALNKHALLHELLQCSLCLGFWVGVLLVPWATISLNLKLAVLFPFASAAWCWSLDALHDAVVCTCKTPPEQDHHEDIID